MGKVKRGQFTARTVYLLPTQFRIAFSCHDILDTPVLSVVHMLSVLEVHTPRLLFFDNNQTHA